MFSFQSLNSGDSLDEFLSMFHNKDNKKAILYQKEQNIIKYLKQLGVIMKTDPLQKQQEHYQKIKIAYVYTTQLEYDETEEEEKNIISTNEVSPSEQNEKEFCVSHNQIFVKRSQQEKLRKHSFEAFDLQ